MKWPSLTTARVAEYQCAPGKTQSIFWDGKTPGLGLRVTAKGAKAYIFETRLHGKTLRITIGDARTWRVWDAQVEATRLKSMTDRGVDPRKERAQQAATAEAERASARREAVTLAEAWAEYVEDRKSRWSALNLRDHQDVVKTGGIPKKRGKGVTAPGPLAALLDKRLSEITPDDVAQWLTSESEGRPSRARLSFNLMRIFFNWCEASVAYRGLVDLSAVSNRIARDRLPRKVAKSDSMQKEQLASWFAAVRQVSSPVMSAYLQALLLTGARREELAGLRWENVDFKWRTLTIKDKVEGTREIPLTPYVSSLLAGLQRLNEAEPNVRQIRRLQGKQTDWKPSPWVFFSSKSADGKIASPNYACQRVCRMAGIPPVRLHGLRRSFSSLAEWTEMPVGVVAQIMGHKPSATAERHYKVRPIDLLRSWHEKLEAWILHEAGIAVPAPAARMAPVLMPASAH